MKLTLLLTALPLLCSQLSSAQTWNQKASMLTGRQAPGVAVLGSKIYVMGGSTGSSTLTSAEVYDIANNAWRPIAPLNVTRVELAAAAVNGKIYAIGGWNLVSQQSVVEEYDTTTNTWTTKAPMPTSRSVLSIGVIDNKIYALGGWPGTYATVEMYDPATNTWTTKAPMPYGIMQNNGCTVINGELYVLGGRDYNGVPMNEVFKYTPSTNTWSSPTTLPQALFSGVVTTLNGKVYHIGGRSSSCQQCLTPSVATTRIYDPATQTWSLGTPLTTKRSFGVTATVNGKIYVIGGVDSAGNTSARTDAFELVPTGINTASAENSFRLKQTANMLILSFANTSSDKKKVILTDMNGKVIYQATAEGGAMNIPIENFAQGLYIVTAEIDGLTTTKKITITK